MAITTNVVTAQNIQPVPQLGINSVKEVVAAMTLEEKAKLVVGNGFHMPGTKPQGPALGVTKDRVPGAAGTTYSIPRLGIPGMVVSDGPAGVRIDPVRNEDSSKTYYATAFPVGTLLASSWDTALVERVGDAFGSEVKDYGIDILLGPGMNIHRNPLGGRNFEYYSEDPVVSGHIAAALVTGIQSNGVGTSIKHFVANNQETDRNSVNVIVSERALREIYLKGFEIAVKQAHPWTVMSSYNYINGVYASENHDLLTTVLRDDWNYKGFVMTDWFGGKDPVAQIKAGNNLLMPGTTDQTQKIIAAVKDGSLKQHVLDDEAEGILNIILQSPSFKKYTATDKPDLMKDAGVSRDAAAQGMVLLKNNGNALPLTSSVHGIALFGINSYDLIAGGTGSGDVNKAYTISLNKGLVNAGYLLDNDLAATYQEYIADQKVKHPKGNFFQEFMHPSPSMQELVVDNNAILAKAAGDDLAIISIGRNAGEGRDRKQEDDYYLSDTEKALIQGVSAAFHAQNKKVIVVLNVGGVIDVMSWRDAPDAILLAWQPGLEGGNAISDVLSGKVNPSGKLATTFPVSYNSVPSAKNFPGTEFPERATTGMMGMKLIPAEVVYEDDIYVGYRYYNTFKKQTAYEFGYGMSYTTFSYSPVTLSSATFDGSVTASVTITNTGKVGGKEIVELYVTAPKGAIQKPAEELKAFAKTNTLVPGGSQTLTFTLSAKDLSSYNTSNSSWVAESGTYTVKAGASCEDIKQTATFIVPHDIITEKDHKALAPVAGISLMHQ